MGPNFATCSFCPHGILLGSAFPKPCICSAYAEATASADQAFSQMKEEPNDQNLQHTETNHIVKTRLDDEEHADFLRRLEIYDMNQSEFIRKAISGATIKPTIVATLVSDDLLAAVGKLTAEYGRIGNNL